MSEEGGAGGAVAVQVGQLALDDVQRKRGLETQLSKLSDELRELNHDLLLAIRSKDGEQEKKLLGLREAQEAVRADVREQVVRLEAEIHEASRLAFAGPVIKRLSLVKTEGTPNRGSFLASQLLKNRQAIPSGFIELDQSLWGEKHEIHHVFNRIWYQETAPRVVGNFEDNSLLRTYIIAGNKGTGKSIFSFVLMLYALKTGLIVAYQNANERFWIVGENIGERDLSDLILDFKSNGFEPTISAGVYSCKTQDEILLFNDLVRAKHVMYVVDVGDAFEGIISPYGPKVVISSPNNDKLKRIGEIANPIYEYMPLWDDEELAVLNARLPTRVAAPNALYVQQSESDLATLQEILGGVPRLLFRNVSVEDKLVELETVVTQTPLALWKMLFTVGNYSLLPRAIPGMLIHIGRNPTAPTQCLVEFISPHVMTLALRFYYRDAKMELLTFLNASSPSRMVSAMRGALVEEYMHDAFGSRTTRLPDLEIRALRTEGTFRPFELPPLNRKYFRLTSMMDFTSIRPNDYYQPLISNFPAVDAIALMDKSWFLPGAAGIVGVGFQATVSKKKRKGVPRSELHRVRNRLRAITRNPSLDLFLVFVTVVDGIDSVQVYGRTRESEDDEFVQFAVRGINFEGVVRMMDIPEVDDEEM